MSGTPPPPADRPIAGWWAIVKGLGTVFKQTFRHDNTEQYPKEIAAPPERAHTGRHRLNRHENGLEKCIGCELCAFACGQFAFQIIEKLVGIHRQRKRDARRVHTQSLTGDEPLVCSLALRK